MIDMKRRTLLAGILRAHDGRDDTMHMIFVTEQTVLPRHTLGMAGLAKLLFHGPEIRCELVRLALLVAFQIWPSLIELMARETAAPLHDAEMRFVSETREVPLLAGYRGRGEIDNSSSAGNVVHAMAFRA